MYIPASPSSRGKSELTMISRTSQAAARTKCQNPRWEQPQESKVQYSRSSTKSTVDSKKLEYGPGGPGAIYDASPSSLGFRVGGQSSSNFLPSMVPTYCSHKIEVWACS